MCLDLGVLGNFRWLLISYLGPAARSQGLLVSLYYFCLPPFWNNNVNDCGDWIVIANSVAQNTSTEKELDDDSTVTAKDNSGITFNAGKHLYIKVDI